MDEDVNAMDIDGDISVSVPEDDDVDHDPNVGDNVSPFGHNDGDAMFTCYECGKEFKKKCGLATHMTVHRVKGDYQLPFLQHIDRL